MNGLDEAMIIPWYLTDEALKILADCAKDEPAALLHHITYAGRNTDEWHSYSDPGDTRRYRLVAIKSAVLDPNLSDPKACHSGACEKAGLMVSLDMAIEAFRDQQAVFGEGRAFLGAAGLLGLLGGWGYCGALFVNWAFPL